jgi:hypothetical protein
MLGVLAELNGQNQSVSRPQPLPSIVVPRQPLVQVSGTQTSRSSGEEDSGSDDEATDTSTSIIPDSRPPTPPSNQERTARGYADPPPVPDGTKKPDPLQTQLGFENRRAYHDFRVYHFSFKLALTLDLVANSYG